MKKALALALLCGLTVPATYAQTAAVPKTLTARERLVRLSIINMSCEPREIHDHGEEIRLPVAIAVPLQIPAGSSIEITSPTNRKVKETITITASDEGRLMNIR